MPNKLVHMLHYEDSIPDFAQDMNKVLGATYIVSRTVDVQVEIITLVNKGGCDMAHMHYINQYIEKNTAASAENSVVLFLKDSPRTKQFLHASLRWRKISEMIFYASRGEFICGIKSRCHTSVFHDSDVLKKYILTNYIRTGDQIATGEDFNASKYKDLGDFVQKELDQKELDPTFSPIQITMIQIQTNFFLRCLEILTKTKSEDLISTPTTTTATTTATINTRLAHKDNRSRLHKSSRNSFSSFVYQVLLFSMEQFPPYSFLYSGRYRNSQQFSAKTLSAVNIISHKDATIHSSRASFHIQPYHTSS